MGHRKCRNTEWEAPKPPKAPKKICTGTLRRLLGIASPSKEMYYTAAGDKEVQEYRLGVIKYMNYRRLTTKEAWRAFYRYLRQKKEKGARQNVRKLEKRGRHRTNGRDRLGELE